MPLRQRWTPAVAALLLSLAGPLTAQDPPAPSLAFSISPQNQPVTLTLNEPKLRYELNLDSLKKEDQPVQVQVVATPFRDSNGNTIQPTVTVSKRADGSSAVQSLGSLPVVIEADLPKPGVYTSHISLVYNDRRWTPPLTLTVTRPAPTAPDLDVPDLTAGRATRCWPDCTTAFLEVGIHEKTGQPLTLPLPQLTSFVHKEGTAAQFKAPVSFTVLGEGDQPLTNPIQIGEGKATRHLRFELDGIDQAGEYAGNLRLTPPGAALINKNISVYVREPLWAALFWIALGVVISYLIREYLIKTRPRLIVLRRIEAARIRLSQILEDSALDKEERELALALHGHLSDVSTRLDLEAITTVDAGNTLDVFDEKLALLASWISLYREHVKGNAAPDATIVAALKEAGITLLNQDADKNAVRAADSKLDAFVAGIAPAARSAKRVAGTVEHQASFEKLNRFVRTSDFLVSLMVLLIACLMGIKALWIGDLSWGGWEDRVIAVLWGLGLHQATFTGVEALRTTLAK